MKYLLIEYLNIFYKTVRFFLRIIQNRVSSKIACQIQNIFLILINSKLRFYYDKKFKLFYALENSVYRYFNYMDRGFDIYGRSLFKRGLYLAKTYCLYNIKFNENDIIIDCGANYGDLFLYLSSKIKENNYITFEPGPTEHICLKKSLPEARNFNLGLSDKN